MENPDWEDVRSRILMDASVTYLNTGSFGLLPKVVFQNLMRLRCQLAERPAELMLNRLPALLDQAREQLARFLCGNSSRLMLTTNVTQAMNQVASLLWQSEPGEVLITDFEYETVRLMWEREARRNGFSVRIVTLPNIVADANEIVQAFLDALSPSTRIFVFSHVLSSTGMVMPAQRICAEARAHRVVTVVDGAHAPGFMPLDLDAIGADFYVGSGHKWLLAPMGVGFAYFGTGYFGSQQQCNVSYNPDTLERTPGCSDPTLVANRIRKLEALGTRDLCSWLVLPDVVEFHESIGQAIIHTRMRELAGRVLARFQNLPGFVPVTTGTPSLWGGITTFRVPADIDVFEMQRALHQQFGVEVAVCRRSQAGFLRVSTHFFNNEKDIDRLAESLILLLHCSGG